WRAPRQLGFDAELRADRDHWDEWDSALVGPRPPLPNRRDGRGTAPRAGGFPATDGALGAAPAPGLAELGLPHGGPLLRRLHPGAAAASRHGSRRTGRAGGLPGDLAFVGGRADRPGGSHPCWSVRGRQRATVTSLCLRPLPS